MALYGLPYGKASLKFNLPDRWKVEMLAPRVVPGVPDPVAAIQQALNKPLPGGPGSRFLPESPAGAAPPYVLADLQGVGSVAIAINDKTRPVPHELLLPPLLGRLEACGVAPGAILLLIASGTHAPMTPAEIGRALPAAILDRYPVIVHDATDREGLAHLGTTSRGTPVWLNRRFVSADLRIVVGDVEPHQFAGFSGGVKTAAIGLAGTETINRNHAMMTNPQACIDRYDDNPVRQDIEEIGRMAGVHLAVNAVLNGDREIVHVLAGDPAAVIQAGIPLVREIFQVVVEGEPFDLMIVSPGGHPKDIDLVQSQKAVGHGAPVTRTGGTMILAAACSEGTGSPSYEEWMAAEGMTSYEAVLARFRNEGLRVGPHKAYQIARDGSRVRLILVSEMPPDFVRSLLLTPAASMEEALAQALPDLPDNARIGIMPLANTTIPVFEQSR